MRQRFALVALMLAATAASAETTYQGEVERWRAEREARLTDATGWLSLVALVWLEPGRTTFGTEPSSGIVLPAGPARAGTFERRGETVVVTPAEGVALRLGDRPFTGPATLTRDREAALSLDRLTLLVIWRGDRIGVRVRDPQSAHRRRFKGLSWFPVDPAYRIEAKFVPYESPRKLGIANVLGQTIDDTSPGYVEFELGGRTHTLVPISEDGDTSQLFFIFRDKTAPALTYGGGRFFYADPPKDGRVTLDFNKAYNPPCAFSDYTTCPLPPKENQLDVKIRAGEKKYERRAVLP
jgi:uncharacterized protein (DUF1684 family)